MKINIMKLKLTALLLVLYTGLYAQNKIVLTAPRLDTSSLSNRINLKANTNLNNVNGVLSSTYGGAGIINGILKANGSGVVSAATASDIPSLSAYYLPLSGGTLTGALSGTSLSMSGATNGGSVNAASGGMSAQSFIRSLGAVFQLRDLGNTVTYGGLTTSGYWEGNSSTDVGIFAETTFGINLYSGGSTAVRQRISPAGNTLIKTTTDNGTDALQVNGSIKVTNGGIDIDDATSIFRANNVRILGTDRKFQVWNNVSAYIDALTFANTGAITASSSVTAGGILKGVGFNQPISVKTANYTLTDADYTVMFNTTSGNLTATLPAGVEGRIYNIGYSVLANQLTIVPNGSETINGDTSFIINSGACYQTVTLQFLSGNWYILSTAYNQSCL